MDHRFQEILESKYNILDIISTNKFDQDPVGMLIPRLEKTRKDKFSANDRYVVVLFDTCFYLGSTNLLLHNLVAVWRHLDIPSYTLILITNHFGISKEFSAYFNHLHRNDQPLVIETFYNFLNYDERFHASIPPDAELGQIAHSSLCLLAGTPRSHRQALYAGLKKHAADKMVLSIRGAISDNQGQQ